MSGVVVEMAKTLKNTFPDLDVSVSDDMTKITIPQKVEGFGSIEIEDYLDDEVIVFVGSHSHRHVNVSDIELGCKQVAEFLSDLFQDKIVVWSSRRSGGHCAIEKIPGNRTIFGSKREFWLWSGRHLT